MCPLAFSNPPRINTARAQDAGDLPGALAAYRCALAIDEGLEDAAAAVEGLQAALAQQGHASGSSSSHGSSSSSSSSRHGSHGSTGSDSASSHEISSMSSRSGGGSGGSSPGRSGGGLLAALPAGLLLPAALHGARHPLPVEAVNGSPENPYGL